MSQFVYLWYNIGQRRDLFRITAMDLCKEALYSLAVSLVIGHVVFVFLEAPIQNILLHLTGMEKRKAKLKQDCSSAKLNAELQEQLRREQASKVFANEKSNEKLNEKSNGFSLYDENGNKLENLNGNHLRYLAKAGSDSSGS